MIKIIFFEFIVITRVITIKLFVEVIKYKSACISKVYQSGHPIVIYSVCNHKAVLSGLFVQEKLMLSSNCRCYQMHNCET
jgi:hypothetical protein